MGNLLWVIFSRHRRVSVAQYCDFAVVTVVTIAFAGL
jgi:hypothetical protein